MHPNGIDKAQDLQQASNRNAAVDIDGQVEIEIGKIKERGIDAGVCKGLRARIPQEIGVDHGDETLDVVDVLDYVIDSGEIDAKLGFGIAAVQIIAWDAAVARAVREAERKGDVDLGSIAAERTGAFEIVRIDGYEGR